MWFRKEKPITPPKPKQEVRLLILKNEDALRAKELFDRYATAAASPGSPCHAARYRLWSFLIEKQGLQPDESFEGTFEIRHSLLTFEVWQVEQPKEKTE